jgi:hypothetical protein
MSFLAGNARDFREARTLQSECTDEARRRSTKPGAKSRGVAAQFTPTKVQALATALRWLLLEP